MRSIPTIIVFSLAYILGAIIGGLSRHAARGVDTTLGFPLMRPPPTSVQ